MNSSLSRNSEQSLVVRTITSKKFATGFLLWLFGLYVCLVATAPSPVTEAQQALYGQKLREARADNIPGYGKALNAVLRLEELLYENKVWFWRFRSEYRERVYNIQADLDIALADFNVLEAKRVELERDARNVVGIWSEYGVEDARALFWDCYERGKEIAKRYTMFDVLFSVGRRDEEFVVFILRICLMFVMNLTLGMMSAIIIFLFEVWSLILLYKASLLSGLLFFLVAAIGAVSVAFTYVFLVAGALGGAGVLLVQTTARNRIENQNRYHLD